MLLTKFTKAFQVAAHSRLRGLPRAAAHHRGFSGFGDESETLPAIPLQGESVETALARYKHDYAQSLTNPDTFWREQADVHLSWSQKFTEVTQGSFDDGDVRWFSNGKLNACYNCVDRHVEENGDRLAIIWEGDEPGDERKITYAELQKEVSRMANVMKANGVKKGDLVTIYSPMIPETAMAMLACARIGAIHSVVFSGFSADALRDRIVNCNSKFVFTADGAMRGGKKLKLKPIVDEALNGLDDMKVFVTLRTNDEMNMVDGRDLLMAEEMKKARPYCPIEPMDSEDPLFVLYTSGSTGQPKGLAHSTAGYLLHAAMTTKTTFDVKKDDIFGCVADCGWITGHTYIVYGPLVSGATTVMFESVPTYPNPYRYWDLVQKHRLTQLYTAPTAIRALMRFDTEPIKQYDLTSLRVLGSVGEPINPEAWRWYNEHVGRGQCTIADTYWQTETGGHLATTLPGAMTMKPGSCGLPAPGIELAVLDPVTGKELEGAAEGVLCIKRPWPATARTVYGDHDRYLSVYTRPYKGYYFTGDGCRRDADGYYWITGRVDDVINPSGHRIGTAELESVLVACDPVSEAAVVGFPHPVKGEGISCFIILKDGVEPSPELAGDLKKALRGQIGPFATPDVVCFHDLPKTRSGKIMRRILRKVAAGDEEFGDTSTLADPKVVTSLVDAYKISKPAS